MSIKLTDTQIVMLSAAAQRDDRCLVAPRNLKGGATQKVATKLIERWPRQGDQGEAGSAGVAARRARRPILCVEANGGGRPGDRRRRPLGVGRNERGTDPRVQVTTTGSQIVEATADVPATAPSLSAPRGGTKLARVLELLQRDCGATLEELIAATDWLPHTTRAALTGLRKRGCAVTIDRSDKERGSTYRARLGETIETGGATGQSDDPPTISAAPKSKNARRVERPQAQQAA